MTIGSTTPFIEYVENGATLTFNIPFQFNLETEILVSSVDPATLAATQLLRGTHFAVAGGGGSTGSITKTSAAAAGTKLRIERVTSRAQTADYATGDDFPAETHEAALDRLAAVDQELDVKTTRGFASTLRGPSGEAIEALPAAASRASRFMMWAETGLSLVLMTAADLVNTVASHLTQLIKTIQKGDPGSPGEGYATRAALAAAAATNLDDAFLTEGERRGKFIFYTAIGYELATGRTLTADVAADAQQGWFIAAAGDPTGAAGAWVRADRDKVNILHVGATGLGVANDGPAIQAAINLAGAMGARRLRIPNGSFRVDARLTIPAGSSNLTIEGEGVITSPMTALDHLFQVDGDNVSFIGVKTVITAAANTSQTRHYRTNGKNLQLHRCVMEYSGDQNCPAMDVRTADGFVMMNCTKRGSNAFMGNFEANGFLIAYNDILGAETINGDDAIAIKTLTQSSGNGRIAFNRIRRHAAMVSFGSQIGVNAADDPTYSRSVSNVEVVGNIGELCSYFAYIKPGAVAEDWRNGLVEGITFTSNQLIDKAGVRFDTGFRLRAGRGAKVDNIQGSDNTIIARAFDNSASGTKYGALVIEKAGGGANVAFSNIHIGVKYDDPFDGAAFGAAGTTGYPVDSIVFINPAGAALENIKIDVEGNGCALSGIDVLAGADDKIAIERATLTNVNASNNANAAGIRVASRVRILTDAISIAATGNPYRVMNSGTSELVCNRVDTVHFADLVAAADDKTRTIWSAPRGAYLARMEVMTSNAIAKSADDSNYVAFKAIDPDNSNTEFGVVNSRLTGGQAFPANAFSKIVEGKDLSGGDQHKLHFDRGERLQLFKDTFGTGAATNDVTVRLHWAPW